MVEAYQRRSALAHFGLNALATQGSDGKAGITVGEIAHRAIINIRGNARTRDYVIRREFDIVEGDAFNRALIDRAERRLKALAY